MTMIQALGRFLPRYWGAWGSSIPVLYHLLITNRVCTLHCNQASRSNISVRRDIGRYWLFPESTALVSWYMYTLCFQLSVRTHPRRRLLAAVVAQDLPSSARPPRRG